MHQKNVGNSLPTHIRSLYSHAMAEWKEGPKFHLKFHDHDSEGFLLDRHQSIPQGYPSLLYFIRLAAVPVLIGSITREPQCPTTKIGGS
jgi:hypothetical protein